MKLDRRTLIAGGGAGALLVVGYLAWPRRPGSALRALREGERVLGPYLKIAADGQVTVAVPQAETGQGSWTGLAQVAADELGADWARVAVEPAPLAEAYANPLAEEMFGIDTRLTAASTAIRAFEGPIRESAAAARQLLCLAAAEEWGIAAEACVTRAGKVVAGDRVVDFGALVESASRIGDPGPVRLRSDRALTGRGMPRVDLPAKSRGSWRFAADVRLPGMRFASLRMAPPGGRLTGFDRGSAEGPEIKLVIRDGWLAAIGPTWWAAEQALRRAKVRFEGPVDADSPTIESALRRRLKQGQFDRVEERGDYAAATAGKRPLAATYFVAPAPHLGLEPPAAVARWTGGRLHVWMATQAPELARQAIARETGADDPLLLPMGPGDQGGRALDSEAGAIAAVLAREAGVPVALTFPAATAQNQDRPRPPLLARMRALGDGATGLGSWRATFVGAAGLDSVLARLGGGKVPDFAARGGIPPYAIAALLIEQARAELPIETGYLRGDVEALTSFATESFVDEMARARGVEPLAFRIGMLGTQPRLATALLAATRRAGWDGGGRGSAMGLACASAFGSHIALVAETSLGTDQRVRVNRLVAAVDCGRAINPALVRQQVEGGLLHALVTAAGPPPEIVAGVIRARPLAALGLQRLSDLPRIEVELIPSRDPAGGVSGLGALVLAAAVGNALHSATGRRLRRLPFDPMTPA